MIHLKKPKHYLDTFHYKKGANILRLLKNNNHPHIIIHGVSQSGKTTFIELLLKELFEGESFLKKEQHISYYIHPLYYFFDLKSVKDKKVFTSFVKETLKTNTQFNRNNYIVIDHYELLKESNQNIFKVMLEKSINYKFIFISNKLQKIISPIQSRCCIMRFTKPTTMEIELYKKMNPSLVQENSKYIDIYDKYIEKYCNILFNPNFSIANIKTICESICQLCFSLSEFMNRLLKYLGSHIKKTSIMIDITEIVKEYDSYFNKSYRKIICLESMTVKLYKTIQSKNSSNGLL